MTWAIARRALEIANEANRGQSALDGALSRYRADVARTRSQTSGDTNAPSTTIVVGPGDSLSEAYAPTKREFMWTRHLSRRLNGQRMASLQYYPAATSTFSVQTAGDWPGSQAPWTFSSAPTGRVDYGADLHSVTMASGSTATLTYFGDVVTVAYTRTTGGPSAAAVTLNGVAQTAINAQGSESPGLLATFGTAGQYGYHTLVVTSTSGQLVLEGAMVSDNEAFPFGVPCRAVRVVAAGHAGFSTSHYVDNQNWATSLVNLTTNLATGTYPSLFIIGLGANDWFVNGVPASTYRDRLVTIAQRIDARIDAIGITTDPGFLFLGFPAATTDDYVNAMWDAAATIGLSRAGVLDLRQFMPGDGSSLGVFNNAGHPNDAGQKWIAEKVANALDGPNLPVMPVMAPAGPVIDATTPAAHRSNWAESLAFTSTTSGVRYDVTTADNQLRARVHREWLEPGVYQGLLRYGEITTTGGQAEVLVGGTSLGTVTTTGTTNNVAEATLSTQVTIDTPGAYPITVRKTTANAAAFRFARLHLRKTA